MRALLLFFAMSFVSFVSIGQNSQDEESVKKVILAFQEDFNEGDFKNAASYTTDDWEHLNPNGGILKGRDVVVKRVREVHQTFLKGVTMSIESMSIRFITLDVAIANVIHKMNDYESPKGVKHENERRFKSYVVVKQKGKWLLAHDQNTNIANQ